MNISKNGEKILEALAGGENVFAETLEKITPDYKTTIGALKKAGANIKGYQEKESGRIFYVLVMEAEEETVLGDSAEHSRRIAMKKMVEAQGEDSPPDVRPQATSPAPAAPAASSSPAESPGASEVEPPTPGRLAGIRISDLVGKTYPKTGRMKIEGWVEDADLDARKDVAAFLITNPSEIYLLCISPEAPETAKTAHPAKEAPEVEESPPEPQTAEKPAPAETTQTIAEARAAEAGVEIMDAAGKVLAEDIASGRIKLEDGALDDEEDAPPLAVGPDLAEVPIYNESGDIIGYRRVTEKPEKSPEDLKKEVAGSGISTAAAAGMEKLLDGPASEAPDHSI